VSKDKEIMKNISKKTKEILKCKHPLGLFRKVEGKTMLICSLSTDGFVLSGEFAFYCKQTLGMEPEMTLNIVYDMLKKQEYKWIEYERKKNETENK
jgi:hypothetical protein